MLFDQVRFLDLFQGRDSHQSLMRSIVPVMGRLHWDRRHGLLRIFVNLKRSLGPHALVLLRDQQASAKITEAVNHGKDRHED